MFEHPKAFNHVYRAIHSLFFLFTLYSGKILLKNRWQDFKLKPSQLIFASGIIFFSASFLMVGQPEEYAFVFILWYLIFRLSENKILNWLSGIFVLIIFSLKVTTIGFLVYPAAIFLFHRKQINFQILFKSGIAGVLLTLVVYLTLLKPDFKDVFEASLFQKSGVLNFNFFKRMVKAFLSIIYYQPFLFLGVICFLIYSLTNFRKSQKIAAFIAIILVGFVIYYQSKFFPYHFIILFPFGVLGWFFLTFNKVLLNIGFSLCFLIIVLTNIQNLNFNFKNYFAASGNYNYTYNYLFRKQIADDIGQQINSKDEEILFLTEGGINYFLPNPSYSKYFYPLPLQRVALNPQLKETEVYQQTLNDFLNYQGEYIVWQPDWFNLNLHPKFKDFVE